MGAVGDTTTTDPRSRHNRVGRRCGQLLTRALDSSNTSACPLACSRCPSSRMVAQYAGTKPVPAERAGTAIFIPVTNAVESLHRSLRKIIKTRGSFPTDEAALKLLFLAIRNAGIKWRRPVEWTTAMGQFAILFGDRFEPSAR